MALKKVLITAPVYLIVPVLFFLHGLVWVSSGISSALLVYLMKLSFILFAFGLVLHVHSRIVLRGWVPAGVLIFFLIFFISCLSPIISGEPNFFYYISDAVGIIMTFIYFICVYLCVTQGRFSLDFFLDLVIHSTVITSIIIIAYYIYSGGDKVSIPPEIHLGVALFFSSLVLGVRKLNTQFFLFLVIILFASILSLQRINILIVFLSVFLAVMPRVFKFRFFIKAMSVILLVALPVGYWGYDKLHTVAASFEFNFGKSDAEFKDPSANQRIIEAKLIINEMSRFPSVTWLIGKGFGAEYTNDGVIEHYNEKVHHAHSTIFVVLLRNGLLGLGFFVLIPFFFIKSWLSKNSLERVFCIGLFCTYIALLSDQYLYWGAWYGLSLACCVACAQLKRPRCSNP